MMAKVPRQKMSEQDAADRIKNFDEVPYGYTEDGARTEASRCLQCKKPKCVDGCPVNIDIPAFLGLIVGYATGILIAMLVDVTCFPEGGHGLYWGD